MARKYKSPGAFNLNDRIRFRITAKGHAFIKELNATHPVYSRCPLIYTADADGWSEEVFWSFANVFGPTFHMGMDQAVETTVELIPTV